MKIKIKKVEQLGPTVLVRAEMDDGKKKVEKEVQGYDLPFDETGYLSMLLTRYNELEVMEQPGEPLEEPIEIPEPVPIGPEKLEKAREEVEKYKGKEGKIIDIHYEDIDNVLNVKLMKDKG